MESMVEGVQLFQKGGLVMYILLVCSLFVVYIGAERAMFYKRMDAGRVFAAQFYAYMKARDTAAARQLACSCQGGLPVILQDVFSGLAGTQQSAYMEAQSGIFIANLRSRLYYLQVMVTLAPLLGLLGTISGMITSFSIFHIQSGQAAAITGGVGEALVATAFGLCVAVLSLLIHAYFTQWLERMITDMEMCFSAMECIPVTEDGEGCASAR